MGASYLKIAVRNLWRNKVFTMVNILGLALSMAVGIKLVGGVKNNFDTDHFHPDYKNVFRVLTNFSSSNNQYFLATSPLPLSEEIRQLPNVENLVNVRQGEETNVLTKNGEVGIKVMFTEPSFFEIFGFKLLSGSPKSLNSPTSVFLNENIAKKIFGNKDPLGQSINIETIGLVTVAGIIENPKLNTHLPIEAMLSLKTADILDKRRGKKTANWQEKEIYSTYLSLNSANNFETINEFLKTQTKKTKTEKLEFLIQPIDEITPWNPEIINDRNAGMNWEGIMTNLLLALGLTLIAAFNYTSLSLARAISRAKEIGVRKTNGATRVQIFYQFLIESILVAFISLFCSFVFLSILDVFGISSDRLFYDLSDLQLWFVLIFYSLLTGIVAGVIPAWLLSSFQPIKILRNLKTVQLIRGVGLYKILIVVQLSITTAALVFFMIFQNFGNTFKEKFINPLPDNLIVLNLNGQSYSTLKSQIEELSQVETVSTSSWLPATPPMGMCSLYSDKGIQSIRYAQIDPSFDDLFGVKPKFGRSFPKNYTLNAEQYLMMNEAAAKLISTNTADVIGKVLKVDSVNLQVIGIYSDDLTHEARPRNIPCFFRYIPSITSKLVVKTNEKSEKAVLKSCKELWRKNFPTQTPDMYLYKESLGDMNEFLSFQSFIGFIGILLLTVACLGIFGITAYALEIRSKEIAIRRFLGAKLNNLVWELTKEFIKLLAWSGLFGMPIGWLIGKMMQNRMGDAVNIGPKNLILGFAIVVLAGLLTAISQSIRSMFINPSEVLKSE